MSDEENVHKGHRQRMRDHVQTKGFDGLAPHQVLEILLYQPFPRQDVSGLAHRLCDAFGGIGEVLSADEKELMKVEGIGQSAARWLRRVGDLMMSYSEIQTADRPHISNYSTAVEFVEAYSEHVQAPATYQMTAYTAGILHDMTKLTDSTRWAEPEMLRQGLEAVLLSNVRNVIIVCFLGSELPHVREYDVDGAIRYAFTLSSIGVNLLDVILVSDQMTLSLKKERVLDSVQLGENDSHLPHIYLREEPEDMDDAES